MGLYYIASEENQAYLAHHGVKGQKWGIRRYQNPDGTLSAKGLKRYGHMQNQEGKSSTTRKVMKDWWDLDDDSFARKYRVNKEVYSKRVKKYGDPYMNSPLAQWAKRKNAKKIQQLRNAKNTDTILNRAKKSQVEFDLKGTGQHLSKDFYIKKHEKR